MTRYKIGNRIITCDSPVKAAKIAKHLDSIKDASPINVKKVYNVTEKYIVLEEDRPDGKESYWVVAKDKYHGEKQYMGGGTWEFHLDKAIETARHYTIIERLNAKYGEKEGYKRWMAGYTDSIKTRDWSGIYNGVIYAYTNGKWVITWKDQTVETFPADKFDKIEDLYAYIDARE